jgi:glutamate 5-kinase
VLKGQAVGTFFEGSRDKRQARKTWIASLGSPKGQLIIDDGAAKAINEEGGSLLPVGITALKGEFKKGDLVACQSQNKEVARGFCNFSASELDQIIGIKSEEINSKLGYTSAEEVIHRDNLVLS